MKLANITEGRPRKSSTFGNLASLAAAKIGGNPEDKRTVQADQKLFTLVQKAKAVPFHLFDKRAIPWWKHLFNHFNIPQNLRMEIMTTARSKFYDRLDHSLFEADISKIADFLNPRTREGTAKSFARAAVAEKLATAVIGYVSRVAMRISRKTKASPPIAKKASQSSPSIRRPPPAKSTKASQPSPSMAKSTKASQPSIRRPPPAKKPKKMPDEATRKAKIARTIAAQADKEAEKETMGDQSQEKIREKLTAAQTAGDRHQQKKDRIAQFDKEEAARAKKRKKELAAKYAKYEEIP